MFQALCQSEGTARTISIALRALYTPGRHKYNGGMKSRVEKETGALSPAVIAIVLLVILFVTAGSLAIWSFVGYSEAKQDVDTKIALAVAQAKKAQADADEAKFAEREKEPNRQFVGPEDYGRLTFMYPKTWSVYEATNVERGTGGTYEAYLNPGVVPPISGGKNARYALRVSLVSRGYDQMIGSYSAAVKKGDLKSSAITVNGHVGTRFDGKLPNGDIRGSAVVFKIRDKTATLRTEAETFRPDFDKLLQSLNFNT